MQDRAVIVGMGEMGGVFARALLQAGHPVYPVGRNTDPDGVAAAVPDPVLALVAVGESDLDAALDRLPASWRSRVGLLQNELLPVTWQRHGLAEPTVIAVWFEKKPGRPVKVIRPSPVFGPAADLVASALGMIGIPARTVPAGIAGTLALVEKNLYILVSNIAGLVTGGTVGTLWADHRTLATEVAGDVMDVQQSLTGLDLPRDVLLAGLADAFAADPDHGCTGRSAPARLRRALHQAAAAGLAVTALHRIAAAREQGGTVS